MRLKEDPERWEKQEIGWGDKDESRSSPEDYCGFWGGANVEMGLEPNFYCNKENDEREVSSHVGCNSTLRIYKVKFCLCLLENTSAWI